MIKNKLVYTQVTTQYTFLFVRNGDLKKILKNNEIAMLYLVVTLFTDAIDERS
jgi:hypothetical protein